MTTARLTALTAILLTLSLGCDRKSASSGGAKTTTKVVVASYGPSRELYKKFNPAFSKHSLETANTYAEVEMSHGPSGTQAQKIIQGFKADVAALSVDFDIDEIAKKGLIPKDWRTRL